MAKMPTKPASSQTVRSEQRQTYTLGYATAVCPHKGHAATFALARVDAATIRENTEKLIVRGANEVTDNLNAKTMQMHLQRVVSVYVWSACGAGQFHGQKVTRSRDLTTSLANEHRDEDRGGPYGFDDLAAAERAVCAFAHITGETWKPYAPPRPNSHSAQRQSATAKMAAFGS